MNLKIVFVTVAANITDSEHYDDKGDDNQKMACRAYVVPIVVRSKRARKITFSFLFRRMWLTGGYPTICKYHFVYCMF